MSLFVHWLAMNGYACYVWPAYGMVFFVLMANVLSIRWQRLRTRKILHAWFKKAST